MILSPAATIVKKKLSGGGGISVRSGGGISTRLSCTGGGVEQDKKASVNKKKSKNRLM
jgi:hypothetical protein